MGGFNDDSNGQYDGYKRVRPGYVPSCDIKPTYRHHKGKSYETPIYGLYYGKLFSFAQFVTMLIVLMIIGLGLFVLAFEFETTAIVTDAHESYHVDVYNEYNFEYEIFGKTYHGHGKSMYGSRRVHSGDELDIYVHLYNFSYYDKKNSGAPYVVFVVLPHEIICIVLLSSAIKKHRKHKKDIQEIGDINHDGKVDEADFKSLPNMYEKKCPCCGAYIDIVDKECPHCGTKDFK